MNSLKTIFLSAFVSLFAFAQLPSQNETLSTTRQHRAVSELKHLSIDNWTWDSNMTESQYIDLDIPQDTVSFNIMVFSENSKAIFLIKELLDPNGKTFVSDYPTEVDDSKSLPDVVGIGQTFSPNRFVLATDSIGYAGLMVPNNPKLKIKVGRWKLKVAAFDTSYNPIDVKPNVEVLAKLVAGGKISKRHQGQLEINLQFTGSDGLTAESAQTDDSFKSQLNSLNAVYFMAGIKLNFKWTNLKVNDLSPVVDDESGRLIYKMGEPTHGVNIIFVSKISYLNGDIAYGLSGGLPGPIGISGISQNAVLVSTQKPDSHLRQASLGTLMAHEVAHYLGLPHTHDDKVYGQKIFDPFADTTSDNELNNLMMPGRESNALILSPMQKTQLLLSPAVSLYLE